MTVRDRLRRSVLIAASRARVDLALRAIDQHNYIRVLNFHGTPERDRARFRDIVAFAHDHYERVAPSRLFDAMVTNSYVGRGLTFTFDDALRSNAEVAAPIMEQFGTRGIFFVMPKFVECTNELARQFFAKRVRYLDDPATFTVEDYTPMTKEDVRALAQSGHVVGNHTMSHARLSDLSYDDVTEEIETAAVAIERWTQRRCEAFAWTFAWDAISPVAWRCIAARHRFCFGACPGKNRSRAFDPLLIYRTNVESSMHWREAALFMSGFADPLWRRQRRSLREMRLGLNVDRPHITN